MKIQIHRGANQIGGSIIEISKGKTKILLDAGLELDTASSSLGQHMADGANFKLHHYDAIFFSHYHQDHMGLAEKICKETPLYIGADAYRVIEAASRYIGQPLGFTCKTFNSGDSIRVGELTITPLLVDHSAFDSYMLLVTDDQEKILYTGDFRASGRKSFDSFLHRLPSRVDTLICEGTNLGKVPRKADTESGLENQAYQIMQEKTGPIFILQAATNIDRLVTMYRAAKKAGRLFLQELYMAEIAAAAKESIPSPLTHDDVKVYISRSYPSGHFRYQMLTKYTQSKISRSKIAQSRFAMCIRTSMVRYLKTLHKAVSFSDGALIYSMWEGYKIQPAFAELIDFCKESGLEIVTVHISGHADFDAITKLIDRVKPNKIMPVHTENALWFEENFPALVH